MLIYKLSHLDNTNLMDYGKVFKKCKKKVIHLGQLKLFFAELIFLTLYCEPGDLVLYVGSAPGYHVNKLIEMFPDVYFDLWDPREIEVKKSEKVRIYNRFFTNEFAEKYKNEEKRVLFMCDMRNMKIAKFKKSKAIEEMDVLVEDDMGLQLKWCRIINPAYAYLKFRLAYEIPKTKYLDGTIYLQPYSKISTEARLLTNNYQTLVEYDNLLIDKQMAHFNYKYRCHHTNYKKWKDILDKNNLKNVWDTVYAIHITYFYLKKKKAKPTHDEVEKLFMDIINFHIAKYGDKYNVLFKN